MMLVQEQSDRQIADLLLGVLARGDQIDRLEVSKVDVVPLDVDIQQFSDVLLLMISIKLLASELLSDIFEFFVY